jgi:hypothetical protein
MNCKICVEQIHARGTHCVISFQQASLILLTEEWSPFCRGVRPSARRATGATWQATSRRPAVNDSPTDDYYHQTRSLRGRGTVVLHETLGSWHLALRSDFPRRVCQLFLIPFYASEAMKYGRDPSLTTTNTPVACGIRGIRGSRGGLGCIIRQQ